MSDRLIHGDCLEVLADLEPDSIDACVTDPPYGLEFMGKEWDRLWTTRDKSEDLTGKSSSPYLAAAVNQYKAGLPAQHWHQQWAEAAYRVLKPGAHLLAFGGTRTFHRLTCAVEDAGFEIRDCLMYLYGSGFPKSHNFGCKCGIRHGGTVQYSHETSTDAGSDLRDVRQDVSQASLLGEEDDAALLFAPVQRQGAGESPTAARGQLEGEDSTREVRPGQPSVEGRSDILAEARELQAGQVRPVPSGVPSDGAERRVRDGAPATRGAVARPLPESDGSGTPPRPRSAEQRPRQSRTVPHESRPQAGGICPECGGLVDWQGWGTALKPAWEPVIVARKPLIGTVAANVERYGTGAVNVDGCRMPGPPSGKKPYDRAVPQRESQAANHTHVTFTDHPAGRWPANVVLDEEATDEDWRRYFYCAKASRAERNAGLEGTPTRTVHRYSERGQGPSPQQTPSAGVLEGNHHPTVKPLALMRWLVRLVTPPGGTVIDPFMGSGTTGVACAEEGFDFIGIEREAEYVEIARRRIEAAKSQLRLEVTA